MNKKNINTLTRNFIKQFLGITSLLFLIIAYSCEEDPSSLGSNLIPDGNKINYHYDTSLTFKGNVYEYEPVVTSNKSHYTLGYVNDPQFGEFKGEFAGQFLPSIYYDKDSVITKFAIDSAVLYLELDSIYGTPVEDLKFNVYELNTALDEDVDYYSDEDIGAFYSTANLISTNFSIQGDSLLRVRLSSAFADKLVPNDKNDSTYKSIPNFLSVFDGLAIIPFTYSTTRGLCTVNLNSTNSKISLFHDDTLSYSYVFNNAANSNIRFAKYSNDFSSAVANDYLTNSEDESDEFLYLQGINGLYSKITLTNIAPWIQEDSAYSILDAELIVPVYEDESIDTYYPPGRLFLQYEITDTTTSVIEDFIEKIGGGYYDAENKYYRFNIPYHLMDILNGNISNPSLKLDIEYGSTFPHRVILKSADNIKLRVTYTKH